VFGLWKFVQNLFFSDLIWFIYCITYWVKSFKLSGVWLIKITIESIQIIFNRFKYVPKFLESTLCFFWIYSILIWNYLNRFKDSLILFNLYTTRIHGFSSMYFRQNKAHANAFLFEKTKKAISGGKLAFAADRKSHSNALLSQPGFCGGHKVPRKSHFMGTCRMVFFGGLSPTQILIAKFEFWHLRRTFSDPDFIFYTIESIHGFSDSIQTSFFSVILGPNLLLFHLPIYSSIHSFSHLGNQFAKTL